MFPPGLRFVDLFAGVGGFHHGLDALGAECVLAVEIDPEAQQVYNSTFPGTPVASDVTDLTRTRSGKERRPSDIARRVPDHDILCAGFPCQPFSKSGAQQGVLDQTRGTLFFDVMLIIKAKKPRWVMLENVRNLAGPRHRGTWHTIVANLRDAGYRVPDEPVILSPHMLPLHAGGAPQVRERVFILAERVERVESDLGGEPLCSKSPFPAWDPDLWNVEDILQPDHEIEDIARYRLNDDELAWIEAWQAFVQRIDADVLPGFPIWVDAFTNEPEVPFGAPAWKRDFLRKNSAFYVSNRKVIDRWLDESWGPTGQRVRDFPRSRRKFEWQARRYQKTRKDRDLYRLVFHFRPSGIRVKPPTYLPALVAITQTPIIGSRMRRITPIEAARLQGIPDVVFSRAGVSDKAAYRQLGNAVNAGVVEFLARAFIGARSSTNDLAAEA